MIIRADAHPAIIDRDMFNIISEKSKQRNYSEGAFKSIGPSIYLLRGMLICQECGVRMVTGSNSKSSRGKRRYYQCGTYHRKGSSACHRNAIYKDPVETSVINALIREFSILSYPESLEEEIQKYSDYKNRNKLFHSSRIDDEIQRIIRRLGAAKKEVGDTGGGQYLNDYIKQLKQDINNLEKEKLELQDTNSNNLYE